MLRRNMKLRYTLTIPVVAVSVVTLILAVTIASSSRGDESEKKMIDRAHDVVSEMQAAWTSASQWQSIALEEGYQGPAPNGILCPVVNVATLFSEQSDLGILLQPPNTTFAPHEAAEDSAEAATSFRYETRNGTSEFLYTAPIAAAPSCLACHDTSEGGQLGLMTIEIPTKAYDEAKQGYLLFDYAWTAFLAVMVVIALWVPLQRKVTQPVEKLEKATKEIAQNPFRHSSEVDPRAIGAEGELESLVENFNAMIVELGRSYEQIEDEVNERTAELASAYRKLQDHQVEMEALNEQLKRESAYKSDFLAVMSHELKTPLTSIVANVEAVRHITSSDSVRVICADMTQSSELLLRLINQILDAARLDAGKMTLNREACDIDDSVEAASAIIEPLATSKGIDYTVKVTNDIPILMVDAEKLLKILVNLLGNAVKFTTEGGHVLLEINYNSCNETLSIRVEDDGIGIKEEDRDRIFERFVQGDPSINRAHQGTGIGLSLVRDFARMHNGDANAEPTDTGSRFVVTLAAKPWGG